MTFRRKTIATGALVAVLALAIAVPAMAADESDTANTAWGGICRGTGAAATAVSELLGLTSEQIAEERQAGKSLADIAAAENVSKDQLVSTILESRKQVLDEAVEEGRITQERAQLMLGNMETRVGERVSDPEVGPRGEGNANGGCGLGSGLGAGQGQGAGLGCGQGQGLQAGAGNLQL